jgi:outer membrane protein assembly factor BamB
MREIHEPARDVDRRTDVRFKPLRSRRGQEEVMETGATTKTRPFLWVAVLMAACLLLVFSPARAVAARAALTLDPAVGPPTSLVKAKGAGFGSGEVVAVLFDAARVGSGIAGRNGKFTARFAVPAAALPGYHNVEAVGASSGISTRVVFLVRTDWLESCFDARRSCFNRYENVIGPANAGALTAAWRAAVGTDGRSSPVYANGKLFIGTSDGLTGLDPATGAIIINYRTAPVSATPAVIKGFDPQPDPPGKVIFGTTDGNLYAVSTLGERLWQVGLGSAPASPLVIQGVDQTDGKVIVGAGNTLFAFAGDGTRLWATVLEGGDISKAPAVLGAPSRPIGVVVAAGNTLYAVDPGTGGVIWAMTPSRSALGSVSIGDPNQIGDPTIFVGDEAGTLFSIDGGTGTVKASFTARATISGSAAIGDPTLSEPWIFVGDAAGNIYAFDQTEAFPAPIWQAALGGPVDGPPILANGVVYAATDLEIGNPNIFAIDQASGRVLLNAVLPGGVASEPIVADGRLVIATKSGEVVAYDGPDS